MRFASNSRRSSCADNASTVILRNSQFHWNL